MWTLVSGYLISIIFEFLTVNLYKNNFSNKNMPIFGIVIGWFFQEHVSQDFNMTGGKRFMLKRDFRNRFITQNIKIIRNMIFLPHIVSIFELGTFIYLFSYFAYIIVSNILDRFEGQKLKPLLKKFDTFESYTSYLLTDKLKIISISFKKVSLVIFFFIFFKHGILKTYALFDLFFILTPFILIFTIFFVIAIILWSTYLLYIFITVKSNTQIGFLLKILTYKNQLYCLSIYIMFELILIQVNYENLFTENFFKEIIIKLLFFSNW